MKECPVEESNLVIRFRKPGSGIHRTGRMCSTSMPPPGVAPGSVAYKATALLLSYSGLTVYLPSALTRSDPPLLAKSGPPSRAVGARQCKNSSLGSSAAARCFPPESALWAVLGRIRAT